MLLSYFENMTAAGRRTFGNARGVRNVFERILSCQANRLAGKEAVSREDLMQILLEDITAAVDCS